MAYFNVFIPLLGACFNVCAQIFYCRYIMKGKLLKSVYVGFACGFMVLVICECFAYKEPYVEWLSLVCANLIIYSCFSYCYFGFINMGETARRIRLLRELYDAPEGLTEEQILSRYNAEEIINVRMARLLSNNQVILRDARYYVGSPAMLVMSKILVLMKLIVLGKGSEHDLN